MHVLGRVKKGVSFENGEVGSRQSVRSILPLPLIYLSFEVKPTLITKVRLSLELSFCDP